MIRCFLGNSRVSYRVGALDFSPFFSHLRLHGSVFPATGGMADQFPFGQGFPSPPQAPRGRNPTLRVRNSGDPAWRRDLHAAPPGFLPHPNEGAPRSPARVLPDVLEGHLPRPAYPRPPPEDIQDPFPYICVCEGPADRDRSPLGRPAQGWHGGPAPRLPPPPAWPPRFGRAPAAQGAPPVAPDWARRQAAPAPPPVDPFHELPPGLLDILPNRRLNVAGYRGDMINGVLDQIRFLGERLDVVSAFAATPTRSHQFVARITYLLRFFEGGAPVDPGLADFENMTASFLGQAYRFLESYYARILNYHTATLSVLLLEHVEQVLLAPPADGGNIGAYNPGP